MSRTTKHGLLIGIAVAALIAVLFVEPIPQDPAYHDFADQRMMLGVANGWNVLSNLLLVLVGTAGLARHCRPGAPGAYWLFFALLYAGLLLSGFGSAYYHLAPTNTTLLWDRLPMSLTFMAFLALMLSLHLGERVGRILLLPLLLIGVGSVLYWAHTESLGRGDLRPYGLVQFLPVVLIVCMLWLLPTTRYRAVHVWQIIGVYTLANFCEHFDVVIYAAIGFGGHALKHLLAASVGIFFWRLATDLREERGKYGQ